MSSLVSICMPHLNSWPFTKERIETILAQTLKNWELIIVDSNSDDGSLGLLQKYAAVEPRMRIAQAPRDGIYSNLNRALDQCGGEFIYIATSDDTMKPECLERMVTALQQNSGCGICHCRLEIIDENGFPTSDDNEWENSVAKQFFGRWADTPHVRKAPHDGLLHFYSGTVYTSLTQLLVRRRVFEGVGAFRTDCGSRADFEWGMRAGFSESVVYLPKKLATWRRHRAQATQLHHEHDAMASGEFRRLTQKALRSLQAKNLRLFTALRKSHLNRFYLVSELAARKRFATSPLQKVSRLAVFSLKHPVFAAEWIFTKVVLRRKMTGEFQDAFQTELLRLGYRDLIRSSKHDSRGWSLRPADRESREDQVAAGHSPASNQSPLQT